MARRGGCSRSHRERYLAKPLSRPIPRRERNRSAAWRATVRTVASALGLASLFGGVAAAQPANGATAVSVSIAVPNGAALAGRYTDAGPGKPGVLLFPMCSPTGADGWRPVAERLRAAGVSSLMVAEPGFGPNGVRQARADAALAYLGSHIGAGAPIAVTGGSCGVALALSTAARHPGRVRAVAVLSGPYGDEQLAFVRRSPALAVFAGASAGEPPSPEWARALAQASAHPASRVEIWTPRAHGTDYFATSPAFADRVAVWLAERLTAR